MESHVPKGVSKRVEFLTDGIIAIVSTLLVLEIKVPHLPENYTDTDLFHSFANILPSLVAFIFSFLNILVFWFNHDSVGKTMLYFDSKVTFLNFFFLLFISLIPFTTAFVSEYPFSVAAVTTYGLVLLLASVAAVWMYHHIAFRSDMMHPSIGTTVRKRIWKRIIIGPLAFFVAVLLGFIHVWIPILIYILTPLFFMFLPRPDFSDTTGG